MDHDDRWDSCVDSSSACCLFLRSESVPGGTAKTAMRILGQILNAFCFILLGFFDKMPLAKRVLNFLVPLPPVPECLGDTFLLALRPLPNDFILSQYQLSLRRIYKALKAAAEALKGALALQFLFWRDEDKDGYWHLPIERLKGLSTADSHLAHYLVSNWVLDKDTKVFRETKREWEQAIKLRV